MTFTLFFLGLFSLAVLASRNVESIHRRDTGDIQCTSALCISATVNGSTVQYVLQSTGTYTLGWMGMGFGNTMAHSPMVIMWPNSDGTITLSQRETSAEVMPTVVSDPPRIATPLPSLINTSGSMPILAYTIPANSDTRQNVIWAFGTIGPDDSSTDAVLQHHAVSGALVLDLTKSTNLTAADSPASSSSSTSPSSNYIPLTTYQQLIIAHAILCPVGFLFFLPAGVLLARYLRTFTSSWFKAHWIVQFVIAGSIIVAGVACAIRAVVVEGAHHLSDVHKKWGVAIFTLYFGQVSLGAFIHWIRPKNCNSRPPQNYLHAIFGLLIISLAFYQVRTGYSHEWSYATGRGPLPRVVNILWYVWIVLLPVLYIAGLSFIPKQFAQERQAKASN